MPEIAVDIELYCSTCGEGICALGTATKRRGQPCFQIEPCEKCMDNATSAGFEVGFKEAREKYDVS